MWILLLLALCAVPQASADRAPVTVSAAISLTETIDEIARAYQAAGGGPVRFNFAGSNVLARQLAAGAPVDLFISADEAQMAVAEAAGAIDSSTRIPLVANRLAILVRDGAPELRDARDLTQGRFRRIALGDPSAVPAGVYARQYLEALGIWRQVEDKIVPVGNARAALAAVASGSVDAAIVYATDAAVRPTGRAPLLVTGVAAPRIVYPAAVTARARSRAAAVRFLTFLRSAAAAEIFRRHGFVIAETGSR